MRSLTTVLVFVLFTVSSLLFAQDMTLNNVPVLEVYEPGFLGLGSNPIYDATVEVDSRQARLEPFAANGGVKGYLSEFYVHGLSNGDIYTVSAPGHTPVSKVYNGETHIVVELQRNGNYSVKPAPIYWNLDGWSPGSVGAALLGSDLWTTYPQWDGVIAFAKIGSNPYRTVQTSPSGVALTTFRGQLFFAWRGSNNNSLNIGQTADGGHTIHKVTLSFKTGAAPALTVFKNNLVVAWAELGTGEVNMMLSTDGLNWSTHVETGMCAIAGTGPALATFGGSVWLGYNASHCFDPLPPELFAEVYDGGTWENDIPMGGETSDFAPSFGIVNGKLAYVWSGKGNHLINLNKFDGTGFVNKKILNMTSAETPVLMDYRLPTANPSIGYPLLWYYDSSSGNMWATRFNDLNGFTLPNANFELGLAFWSWYSASSKPLPTLTDDAAEGALSLQENGDGLLYQDVSGLEPGRYYDVSAWVKADPGATATAVLYVHDTTGANAVVSAIVPSDKWQRVTVRFRASGTAKIRVHLGRNPDGQGAVMWDSVGISAE